MSNIKDNFIKLVDNNYLDFFKERIVETGFNKAFIIDKETKERLIAEDPKSSEVIKPLLMTDLAFYF